MQFENKLIDNIRKITLIKNIKVIPSPMRQVLVTTHDIEPEYHVRIQAAWQKHFDNSVSKTVNFNHLATPVDIKKVARSILETNKLNLAAVGRLTESPALLKSIVL